MTLALGIVIGFLIGVLIGDIIRLRRDIRGLSLRVEALELSACGDGK